jgi:hypothetical protein
MSKSIRPDPLADISAGKLQGFRCAENLPQMNRINTDVLSLLYCLYIQFICVHLWLIRYTIEKGQIETK